MKKILLIVILALVAQMTFAQSTPSYVPTNGLVGYWGFDGNANDYSGNGNNGTVNGATLTSDRFGNANKAYDFNSNNNNYIQTAIGIHDTLTFSAWFKCGVPTKYYGMIYSYGDASATGSTYSGQIMGPHPNWVSAGHVGKFHPYAFNNGYLTEIIPTQYSDDNNWHNVIITYIPNDKIYFYYDGVFISNTPLNAFSIIQGIVTFGRDLNNNAGATSNQGKFDGTLDDIGIWNRALTLQEITNLYNATTQAPAAIQSFTVNPDTTGHEGSTYAWSISPAAPLAVITGNGTNSISIAWGNTPEGNYSVLAIETNSLGCVTSIVNTLVYVAGPKILSVVSPINYCYKSTATPISATPSTGSTLKWYTTATIQTALTSAPTPLTTVVGTKTYYVSEITAAGVESARLPIVVNVRPLPSTPTSITSTQSALICKYIGTTNEMTFTTTAVGEGLSYVWTVPEGASIVSGDQTASIGVSFENASATPGFIGAVTVKSVDANSCVSLVKSLTLTTKLPTAPTALTMTSNDDTPHFKGAAVIPATTPATFNVVGVNSLAAITKVGPYVGTSTVFTLTASEAVTADSYDWTLPTGVNQLSGDNGRIITVNFLNVDKGITSLPISVQSVGGCGSSTLKTLSLLRVVPTAPTKLVLTSTDITPVFSTAKDGAGLPIMLGLNTLSAITKVGPYVGTSIPFTLTATKFMTQGATSTSYAWILPEGVNCTTLGATTTTVQQKVSAPTLENPKATEIQNFNAISTPTSTITVNFLGATGTGSLDILVFGVNGSGNSIARKLVLARALPTAPSALVLRDGYTVVTKASSYTSEITPLTLTATPFVTQGAEATSYKWVLPNGVNVTEGATEVADELEGLKTWTGTASVLTINLNGIGVGVTSIPFNVYAVNGAGPSIARLLTVTSAVPATPGSITTPALAAPKFNPTCATGTITVQVPNVIGLSYAWTVAGSTSRIVSGNGSNSIVIDVFGVDTTTLSISVVANNGSGPSTARILAIAKTTTCGTRIAPEADADAFKVVAHPNPSSEGFTISSNVKSFGVQVYDMLGRSIEQRKVSSGSTQIGAAYPSGTYTLKVSQGENQKTVRVIKR